MNQEPFRWAPEKIQLERVANTLQLRVFSRDLPRGSTVIEATRVVTGKSLPGIKKHGEKYAKRFGIEFRDMSSVEE